MAHGSFRPIWELAEHVFRAAVRAADPARSVRKAWPEALADSLAGGGRIHLIAFGKAASAMAGESAELLGERLLAGVVVCPPECTGDLDGWLDRIRVLPADHPLPTERNILAADAVAEFASHLGEDDRVIVLISGGASAYMCSPSGSLTLEDLRACTRDLNASGATIEELNTVRKHLERLKGGGLARVISPARSSVLVMSDVIGDRLDLIGSGPMTGDPTTFHEAHEICKRFDNGEFSQRALEHLRSGVAGVIPETLLPSDPVFGGVESRVIANNSIAVEGVAQALRELGYAVDETRTGIVGASQEIGQQLACVIRTLGSGRRAVVWGGETTVNVEGATGRGGPCQELVLSAAMELHGVEEWGVIAIATDGIDGPTDAAGAWADGKTMGRIQRAGLEPGGVLARHDSYTALGAAGGLLKAGASGTNVNDVYVGVRRDD